MKFLTYTVTAEAAAAVTAYIPVPYRCVIVGAKCVADYEAGADTTVDLYNDTTKQVSMALSATTTLADVVTGTVDATTIFEAGTAIKVAVSDDAGSATGTITITMEIDPFLSGVSGT